MAKKSEVGLCFSNHSSEAVECKECVYAYTCKLETARISNLQPERVFYKVPSQIQNHNRFLALINKNFKLSKHREVNDSKVHRFFDGKDKAYLFQIIVSKDYEMIISKPNGEKFLHSFNDDDQDINDLIVNVSKFLNTPLS